MPIIEEIIIRWLCMEGRNTAPRININYILILNIILVLNIIDLVLTAIGLKVGYFIEANGLLLNVYEKSPYAFILLKIVIILAFYFICRLNINRISQFIRYLLLVPLSVYSFVFILHLMTLGSLLF